jgi:hypothetical protein
VATPEQSKRAGFPWGRAFRIGSMTGAALAAFLTTAGASVDGVQREDLIVVLLAFVVLVPLSVAVAAVVLRFRRNSGTFEVGFSTALMIGALLVLFGLIAYSAAHWTRAG